MHSIHLTFSDLKGTHTHIGKRHMHAFNESIICKKKSEKFCIEIIDMKHHFWFTLIVHAELEQFYW